MLLEKTGVNLKINSIGYATNAIRFGNALSTEQKKQAQQIQQEIHELEGEGKRIFKFYPQALPSAPQRDTGIGYMDSPEANQMYDLAKNEFGASWIKMSPMGELTDLTDYNKINKRPGAYDRSGLTIGADFIDLPRLATKEFGNILPKDLLEEVLEKHVTAKDASENRIDFTTTLGYNNQEYYPVNDPIGIAYQQFLHKDNPSRELKILRKEFEEYKKDPFYDEIDSRTALFPLLKDWGSGKIERVYDRNKKGEIIHDTNGQPVVIYEGNPFRGLDSNPTEEQKKVVEYMKNQCKGAIDFYKFKQFLAYKCLDKGIDMAHENGLKIAGDAAIGWTWPEVQTFPDAFKWRNNGNTASAGWGKAALNYEDLLEKDDSPAHRLLAMKFENILRHFDGVRVDVGWQYIHPKYDDVKDNPNTFDWSDGSHGRPQPCDKILKFIEQVGYNVKGKDFDPSNIWYEGEANLGDFNLEDWKIRDVINNMSGRMIFATEKEHQKDGKGWASVAYLRDHCGINIDKCIIETSNHDHEGVANCANDRNKSSEQVGGVMRSLGIPDDQWWKVKDDNDHNAHIQKYSTGRFAECDLASDKAILINDMLGRTDKIDYHAKDFNKDYKTRLERNYIENYYKTIPYGAGFVYGDVKNLRADFDGSKQGRLAELYEQSAKIAAYKRRDDGIYTEEQANNSELGDINILDYDADILRNKHINLIA